MFISKGTYGNGVPKNVTLVLVPKAHLEVRNFKIPGFNNRRLGPPVRICGSSWFPLGMVPQLHQRNVYIKRKLLEWATQKFNPCFSATSPPRSTDLQSTLFHASQYRAAGTNLRKFEATFGHGTVIAPTQ